MFGSLRFRLPALFLLGIVLAGIVATAISIRFFQNYTRARALAEQLFGALVVAKPEAQLRSRLVTLIERLAIAFGGGLIVAGLLGFYLTRRITRPLGALTT